MRAVRVTARADAGPVPPDHGDDDPNGPPPLDDEDDDSNRDSDDCADDSSAHSSGSNRRPRSRSPRRCGAAGCTAASAGHANDSAACRVLVAAAGNKWFSWFLISMLFAGVLALSPLFPLGSLPTRAVKRLPASILLRATCCGAVRSLVQVVFSTSGPVGFALLAQLFALVLDG